MSEQGLGRAKDGKAKHMKVNPDERMSYLHFATSNQSPSPVPPNPTPREPLPPNPTPPPAGR